MLQKTSVEVWYSNKKGIICQDNFNSFEEGKKFRKQLNNEVDIG